MLRLINHLSQFLVYVYFMIYQFEKLKSPMTRIVTSQYQLIVIKVPQGEKEQAAVIQETHSLLELGIEILMLKYHGILK